MTPHPWLRDPCPGGTPIGIARLVAAGGGRADLAVEVVDAWQRRGVGERLVRSVLARGRAAGVREVVADTVGAQVLFTEVFPATLFAQDGPEVTFTAPTAGARVVRPRARRRRSAGRPCSRPRRPATLAGRRRGR